MEFHIRTAPQEEGQPVKLVIPTSLQMGWIESPPYFCAASETVRDVAIEYIKTPVGLLPTHKFIGFAATGNDFEDLPEQCAGGHFPYVVEAYVDDYMTIAICTLQEQLEHVATGVMMGVHDVFPKDEVDGEDLLSLKKMKKMDSMWALMKDMLGFTFDGIEKTVWLEEQKRDALLTTLHKWLRCAKKGYSAIPYKEF